ncbi:MAG: shikimate kinase [Gemmatimonadales bacterium]|nr:Shikimate kinase [bacterium HR33]GIW52637.1 MAG: shikimate kinase [Gemmatimonadales bacterium]
MGEGRRHLILVGLPGSGKSTVGKLVAEELDARFVDLDLAIAARAGKSIAEIFATEGEAVFRRLEREAMERELEGAPAVIAAGGGWAAQPGNLEGARRKAVAIYLEVRPEEAARRMQQNRELSERPLLAGQEPERALRDLLALRESWYRLCEARVDGSPGPEQVAWAVVNLARSLGGW